jgi:phospholipid/cholesterol/gamma-HCH transport system substrate-binding protein
LKNILARTEQGKGFLGALTTDSEESVRLGSNLTATLTSLNSILRKVDAGQGLVGKLLTDQKYGKETGDSLQAAIRSVQNVLGKVDEGLRSNNGMLAALLSDPEGKKKVYTFLDNLTTASGSLATTLQSLEKDNGALAILLRDEQFGKEFTQNLRSFSKSLDSIGRKLDSGQGTAGKLINDPAIFDAANHLVIGIDESRLLRWLIRNRQRAGIKKVYDRESGRASPEVSDVSPAPAPPPQPTRRPSS